MGGHLLSLFFRYHIVQEFNKGVYDYIIATDESGVEGHEEEEDEEKGGAQEEQCGSILPWKRSLLMTFHLSYFNPT